MKSVQSVSRLTLLVAIVLTVATNLIGAGLAPEICYGTLNSTDPESGEQTSFPLEHTSVSARVSGTIADVTVTQKFSNPLDQRIEAVYVFPLPDRAAVDDMSIRIGERLIKGEIHRREEAQKIYEDARNAGHLAGLLDQERPNIFSQRLANLLPGEIIEVEIHYVEDLQYDHGDWRLVIPTVVGPRYIPGTPTGQQGAGWSPDTNQVPDASKITPPVLPPGEVSGHHIDISVDLDPGFPITELSSPSHEVMIDRTRRKRAIVRLAPLDTVPNKNFELVWRTAGPAITTAMVAHKTGEYGYMTLILQPPAQPNADQIVPREVVFVLDTSGSMSGEPVAACKQFVRKALKKLRDGDTFRLIQFAGNASMLDPNALPATPANVERALSYLDGVRGGGPTRMLEGVRSALDAPKDRHRLRMVLFLTDGYIGNEQQIIGRIGSSIGESRIFALGIGKSVNRFLLDRMAEAGRGVAEYLRPGESPDELVNRFYDRIADPVFTQLELDWGDLEVVDVEPTVLPDLFAAQPLLVHARYRSGGRGVVTLRGYSGTNRIEITQTLRLPKTEKGHSSQANLWARARIARLEMDKIRSDDVDSVVEDITALALKHRLMTAYTSFVAVERSQIRQDGQLVTVDQPLPMPEGVSHEGVFGDQDSSSRMVFSKVSPRKSRQAPSLGAVAMRVGSGGEVVTDFMILDSPRVSAPPEPTQQTNPAGVVALRLPNEASAQSVEISDADAGINREVPEPLPIEVEEIDAVVPISKPEIAQPAPPPSTTRKFEIHRPLLATALIVLLLSLSLLWVRRSVFA